MHSLSSRWTVKIHYCAFVVIFLVGVLLRMAFLFQPIRYDEAFTFIFFASRPLDEALSDYFVPNNHLFHTLLVHLSLRLFGNQPWILRLPAFVAGVLLVGSSYFTARLFYDKHAALLTAAFVASSSILIEYSTNARGYMLLCLIFSLLLGVSVCIKASVRKVDWIAHGLLAAIGFYTIPIMIYPFAIIVTWLGLSICFEQSEQSRRARFHCLLLSLVTVSIMSVIFYTPVFLHSGFAAVTSNRFVASLPWSSFIDKFPSSLVAVWRQWTRDMPQVVIVILVAGFAAALCLNRRLSIQRLSIIAAAALSLVPLLLVRKVVGEARLWLFLLPLFITVASAGIGCALSQCALSENQKAILMTTVSLLIAVGLGYKVMSARSILASNETGTLRDAEAITLFLKSYLKAGNRVLAITPSDAPLWYYFELHGVPLAFLDPRNTAANKAIAVVNTTHHQSLSDVLERFAFRRNETNEPKVIARFESAVIYRIDQTK